MSSLLFIIAEPKSSPHENLLPEEEEDKLYICDMKQMASTLNPDLQTRESRVKRVIQSLIASFRIEGIIITEKEAFEIFRETEKGTKKQA